MLLLVTTRVDTLTSRVVIYYVQITIYSTVVRALTAAAFTQLHHKKLGLDFWVTQIEELLHSQVAQVHLPRDLTTVVRVSKRL